jgi:hypothetical protein
MRFRPRFSVRTLAILVTVICAYFGAWEVTKRNAKVRANATVYGENDQPLRISNATIPMPFLVVRDECQYRDAKPKEFRRSYYVWLFGPMFRVADFPPLPPDQEAKRLHDMMVQRLDH